MSKSKDAHAGTRTNMASMYLPGSYVPISTGQMRNEWFPKRVAEYVTDTHLKELKTKQVTTDRDFQFGLSDPSDAAHASSAAALGTSSLAAPVRPKPASKTVEVELLTVRT